MNYLEGMALQNIYFALRHGKSIANQEGIIASRRLQGCGLTREGITGVQENIDTAILDGAVSLIEPAVIFSSHFPRAHQTALIVKKSLGIPEVHRSLALRERDFGDFDGQSVEKYAIVWQNDRESIEQRKHEVESVAQVRGRMTGFVKDIEEGRFGQFQGEAKTIFLISHGDPLQILETAFRGMNPGRHRDLPELKPGEIRRLG